MQPDLSLVLFKCASNISLNPENPLENHKCAIQRMEMALALAAEPATPAQTSISMQATHEDSEDLVKIVSDEEDDDEDGDNEGEEIDMQSDSHQDDHNNNTNTNRIYHGQPEEYQDEIKLSFYGNDRITNQYFNYKSEETVTDTARRRELPAENIAEEDDNISVCSELSVGRETISNHSRADIRKPNPSCKRFLHRDEDILDVSDTRSNSSKDADEEEPSSSSCATTPLNEQQMNAAAVAASTINPFALANSLRFPMPFGLQAAAAAAAAQSTVNISPYQEEFLRKSHLYAEELMKHQMQLMAAARASAFTQLRHHQTATVQQQQQQLHHSHINQQQHTHFVQSAQLQHLNPLSKIGHLNAAAAAAAAAAALNAVAATQPKSRNQQYLEENAIAGNATAADASTIANSVTTNDCLAKLTALTKQSSNATNQMMTTFNHLQQTMQSHLPQHQNHSQSHYQQQQHHHHLFYDNNNHDNLHERALKFSIDNILKADFGKANQMEQQLMAHAAASLAKQHNRYGKQNKFNMNSAKLKLDSKESSHKAATAAGSSLDLHQNISSSTQTFSSSLASICTNSNDSNSTAVSSSYGGSAAVNGGPSVAERLKFSPSAQNPALSPNSKDSSANKQSSSATEENSTNSANNTSSTSNGSSGSGTSGGGGNGPIVWPAWVYCTRYSDRPSSGPRVRKPKKTGSGSNSHDKHAGNSGGESDGRMGDPTSANGNSTTSSNASDEKRPRTAFSGSQLARLKHEFNENRYLAEKRRQQLSSELGLNEAQIKIWFQNKRAKLKKSSGVKNPLALQLMAQGLYNHSTIPLTREEEELQEMQERENNSNSNLSSPRSSTSGTITAS